MPGLVPGIHVLTDQKTEMAGTSPAMTMGQGPENAQGAAKKQGDDGSALIPAKRRSSHP